MKNMTRRLSRLHLRPVPPARWIAAALVATTSLAIIGVTTASADTVPGLVARDDRLSAICGAFQFLDPTAVMSNDSIPDAPEGSEAFARVEPQSQPAHGTLIFNDVFQRFEYTPTMDAAGKCPTSDSITYNLLYFQDDLAVGSSNVATIHFSVAPANEAQRDHVYLRCGGKVFISFAAVLANDTYPAETVTSLKKATGTTHGTLRWQDTPEPGWLYIPTVNSSGKCAATDKFSYQTHFVTDEFLIPSDSNIAPVLLTIVPKKA
jgi:hypothetical protein